MISFQKIYGLYGLKHHTMEINGDVTMETNDKRTRSENRASQQIDQGLLTFAIFLEMEVHVNSIRGKCLLNNELTIMELLKSSGEFTPLLLNIGSLLFNAQTINISHGTFFATFFKQLSKPSPTV